jgi:nucleoid-associated protein YgaU
MTCARFVLLGLPIAFAAGMVAGAAQAEVGGGAGPSVEVRQRAEELAREASRRYDELMRGERVAQAERGEAQSKAPPRRESRWMPSWLSVWLERSDRAYRGLVRRLFSGGEGSPAPGRAPPSIVRRSPTTVAGDGVTGWDWLTQSDAGFQAVMRGLSVRQAWDPARDATVVKAPVQPPAATRQQTAAETHQAEKADQKKQAATAKAEQEETHAAAQLRAAAAAKAAQEKQAAAQAAAEETRKQAEADAKAATDAAERQRRQAQDQLRAAQAAQAEAAKVEREKQAKAQAAAAEAARRAEAERRAKAAAAWVARLQRRQAEDRQAAAAKAQQEKAAQQAAAKAEQEAERQKAEALKTAEDAARIAAKADQDRQRADAAAKAAQEQRAADDLRAREQQRAEQARQAKEAAAAKTDQVRPQAEQRAQAQLPRDATTPKPAGGPAAAPLATQPAPSIPAKVNSTKAPRAHKVRRRHKGPAHRKPHRRHHHQAPRCSSLGAEAASAGWYRARSTDTLWGIAERQYGAGRLYRRIYAANRRRLRNPDVVRPCLRLYIPPLTRTG